MIRSAVGRPHRRIQLLDCVVAAVIDRPAIVTINRICYAERNVLIACCQVVEFVVCAKPSHEQQGQPKSSSSTQEATARSTKSVLCVPGMKGKMPVKQL
jgi:hypothetical protein